MFCANAVGCRLFLFSRVHPRERRLRTRFGTLSAKEKTQILFTIKGAGHGLGMSQFGGNELAKEEKDYVEILKYFFQDAIITKIE